MSNPLTALIPRDCIFAIAPLGDWRLQFKLNQGGGVY